MVEVPHGAGHGPGLLARKRDEHLTPGRGIPPVAGAEDPIESGPHRRALGGLGVASAGGLQVTAALALPGRAIVAIHAVAREQAPHALLHRRVLIRGEHAG